MLVLGHVTVPPSARRPRGLWAVAMLSAVVYHVWFGRVLGGVAASLLGPFRPGPCWGPGASLSNSLFASNSPPNRSVRRAHSLRPIRKAATALQNLPVLPDPVDAEEDLFAHARPDGHGDAIVGNLGCSGTAHMAATSAHSRPCRSGPRGPPAGDGSPENSLNATITESKCVDS